MVMAPISVRRPTIERELAEEIPNSYVIVAAPDHPLLIEGPDVLIGGEGNLVAVFTPKASERKNQEHLSVRFILSRLALPPQTRHVLLFEGPQDDPFGQDLSNHFAAALPWHRRRDVAKIVQDRNATGSQRDLPPEIIQVARQRFSDVYQVTRVLKQWTARHRSLNEHEHRRVMKPTPAREGDEELQNSEQMPRWARATQWESFQEAPGVVCTRAFSDQKASYPAVAK